MKVVVFSTDRNILRPEEAAFKRQQAYAAHFDAYTVLIGSRRTHDLRAVELAPGSLAMPWSLASAIASVRAADVISTQDPFETGFVALIFAFVFRKPLHVQVHTDVYKTSFGVGIANRIRRLLAGWVLGRARRVRVVSEDIAEGLEAHGVSVPITVLPIFVDIKRLEGLERKKHPEWKIALLSIGRLEKEKRFEKSIDVVAQLQARGHDAGLTIVGSGSEEEGLKQHARTLHVERFVRFVPWAQDVTPFLSQADLVLVPSAYEGYGLVIIEALAAGVPVLSTDVGIAQEAGAMVVSIDDFTDAAERWVSSGPRQTTLMGYPYSDFQTYVRAYCEDIQKTINAR